MVAESNTRRRNPQRSRFLPCAICGRKNDGCTFDPRAGLAWCMRVSNQSGYRYGNFGWEHVAIAAPENYDASQTTASEGDAPNYKPIDDATIAARDVLFGYILSRCTVQLDDKKQLARRGLTEEQIARHGYMTFPTKMERNGTLLRLDEMVRPNSPFASTWNAQHPTHTLAGHYERLPGIYTQYNRTRSDRFHHLSPNTDDAYLAIPVRAADGSIVGIRLRSKGETSGPRYKWLSGGKASPSGAPCHVAQPRMRDTTKNELWITEGEIKANIAADALNVPVISLAGVGTQADIPNTLDRLAARGDINAATQIVIAFDQDDKASAAIAVKAATTKIITMLRSRGLTVAIATWQQHKGIDDLLMSGDLPNVATYVPPARRGVIPAPLVAPARGGDLTETEDLLADLFRKLIPASWWHRGKKVVGWDVPIITTGVGKTSQGIARLMALLTSGQWPKAGRDGDARILWLFDTKKGMEEKTTDHAGAQWIDSPVDGDPDHSQRVWKRSGDEQYWIMEGRTQASAGESYCANPRVNVIAERRHLAMLDVCVNKVDPCPHADTCKLGGYLHAKALSKTAKLVFATKAAYLTDSKELQHFDMVIIDEDAHDHLLDTFTVERKYISEWAKVLEDRDPHQPELRRVLAWWDAASFYAYEHGQKGQERSALASFRATVPSGYTGAQLLAVARRSCRATKAGGVERAICEYPQGKVIPFRAIANLAKALEDEWDRDDNADTRVMTNEHGSIIVRMPRMELVRNLASTRVVWLDATANVTLLEMMMDAANLTRDDLVPLRVHRLEVDMSHVEVIQITDGLYSRATLKNGDGMQHYLIRETIRALAKQRDAVGQVAYLTYRMFDPNVPDSEVAGADEFHSGHYGNDEKATDRFKADTILVTVGNYTPNIGALRAELHAWRFSPLPHTDTTHRETYSYPGHPLGVERPCHDDAQLQAMIEHCTWAVQAQAIGRLRAVRRTATPLLWVRFDKTPFADMIASRLMTHNQLREMVGIAPTQQDSGKRHDVLRTWAKHREEDAQARCQSALDALLAEDKEITVNAIRQRSKVRHEAAAAFVAHFEASLIITRGGTDDTLYRSNTNVRTSASNNPDAPPDIPFKTPTVLIYEALKAQGLDDSASLHRAMIIRGTLVCIDPDCRDCATFTEGAYAV